MRGVKMMLTSGVSRESSRIFGLNFWLNGGGESFDWHGVVAEFIVNLQPRCTTGIGCVHVGNLPMQVEYPANISGLFYHICSLATN